MTWPAIILWLLLLFGVYAPATFSLYLFYFIAVFGGLSLLPPGLAGNVPPETLCAALLIVKTFAGRKGVMAFLNYALDIRKLGILGLFGVYVLITSILYPRLLAGSVRVYSLNIGSNLSPLGPSSTNITQPIYMLVSIGMCFVSAHSGRYPEFRRHFLYASLFGASLLLLSGFVDMILGDLGREDLLAPLHNATYHLLDSVSIAGQKRVVGFMPEASVFGGACCSSLGFVLFNRRAFEGRLQKWVIPLVAAGLAYMIYASTSSAAYVSLALIAAAATITFVVDMSFTKQFNPARIRMLAWTIVAALTAVVGFAFLPRAVRDHMYTILDTVIFQKSSSFSYLQRSSWTNAGIAAFWATDGVGIGVGSIRTSSWLVNFAASTGIAGLLLFGSFILRALIPPNGYPDAKSRRLANGLKLSLLPGFVVISLAGTTPNPGASTMLTLGLIYALQQKQPAPARVWKTRKGQIFPPPDTSLKETEPA